MEGISDILDSQRVWGRSLLLRAAVDVVCLIEEEKTAIVENVEDEDAEDDAELVLVWLRSVGLLTSKGASGVNAFFAVELNGAADMD